MLKYVISSNGGDMTKLKDEIIDLQKEMFFGKTMLPDFLVDINKHF